MKSTYTIPEMEREAIQKAISRYQKKAAAYGKTLHVEYGTPYATEQTVYDRSYDPGTGAHVMIDRGTRLIEVFDLTIESEIIQKDGYSVIAKIEHLDGGNVVSTFGGETAKPKWMSAKPKCEHCGSNRSRRVTFIVRHEDGSERQVGRSCMMDYCGINPERVAMLNQLCDLILDEDIRVRDFESRPVPRAFDAVEMLALAKKVFAEQGYVRTDDPRGNRWTMAERCERYIPTDDELVNAKNLAEGIEALNAEGDSMIASIQSIIRSGYCKKSHFGFIAYAPIAYEKYMEKMKRKSDQIEAERNSTYIGEVGQRITVEVSKMELVTSWETMYGYTYLYKFLDEQGNVLVWFASKVIDDCKAIKSTVKSHVERDGVKQTIITRCRAA